MKNKIGLYIRVSTEEQARIQDGSLVSQRKRLEEYVEGQNRRESGWGKTFDVYVDEGKSAKNMNRPEFQRLLRDIQSGHINLVLATELSRLSRSIRDFCELWDFFKEHKTGFVTLREQFDTTTAAGEMMVFNLINFAQFERKQTSERLIANFTSRAQRGLWNGGQIPLGYKRNPSNPGSLLVEDREAESIQMIFAAFLKTKNLRETCLALSAQGVRTKQFINRKDESKGGNHFTVASLHHLLTNATYIGLREINKKRGDNTKVKASWPGMVEEKDFVTVQKILEGNRRRYKPDEWKTYPYPLTGITACGECGQRFNGKSAHGNSSKHHYYDHSRTLKSAGVGHQHKCQVQRVRAERFEDLVARSLKSVLMDKEIFEKGIRAYREGQNTDLPMLKSRIKQISASVKENEKRVENLVNRIAELPQEVSAAPLYRRLEELQAKIREENGAKDSLELEKIKSGTRDLNEDELKTRIARAIKHLEEAPKEKQREVFTSILQVAEVHATKLRLGVIACADDVPGPRSNKDGGLATGGPQANVISILGGNRNQSLVSSHTIKIGGERGI
jgi:site-specific DNA recombinase